MQPAPEIAAASPLVVDPVPDATATTMAAPQLVNATTTSKRTSVRAAGRERSVGALIWYRFVQYVCATLTMVDSALAGDRPA